jgi:dipeptidase
VATVLRSHYNGTKYDPYDKAKGDYRAIMVQTTMESNIIQFRQDMPNEIAGVQLQALGSPEHSIYIPLYSGITDVAPALKNAATADNPSYDNAYWIFKTTDVLATPYYKSYMKKFVNPTFEKIEKQLDMNLQASDEKAVELYKSNPADKEALLNYLTEESLRNTDYTLNKVIKLNNKMFIKSTDSRNKK